MDKKELTYDYIAGTDIHLWQRKDMFRINTDTAQLARFMKIRKGLLDPDKLRMSFLSVEPREAVGVLRDNELEYAYSKVERIAGNKDIQHDQQLLTVLRRHMFLINARRHSIE